MFGAVPLRGGLFPLEWSSLWSSIRVSQFSFRLQVCHVWRWIFKPKSVYAIKAWSFPVLYFLSVALSPSECMFTKGISSSIRNCFPIIYPFGFCYDLSVPIFCSKFFLPPSHPVLGMTSPILPLIVDRIFSLIWNVLFYLYCFVLSLYLFSIPSFTSIFVGLLKFYSSF